MVDDVSSSHTISTGEYTLSALCDLLIESINTISPGIVNTLDQGYQIVTSSTKSQVHVIIHSSQFQMIHGLHLISNVHDFHRYDYPL